jgi:hypothetical protein
LTLKNTFKLALVSLSSLSILLGANAQESGEVEGLAFLAQSDMEGPQATNVLSDVSLAGDTLSFSMQTQQGSLNVSFELEGDTLSGGLSTPQGNLPIVGKKSA